MKSFNEGRNIGGCEARWFEAKKIFEKRGIYKDPVWLKNKDRENAINLGTTEKWAKADREHHEMWQKKKREAREKKAEPKTSQRVSSAAEESDCDEAHITKAEQLKRANAHHDKMKKAFKAAKKQKMEAAQAISSC